jgi:hypothetical protein
MSWRAPKRTQCPIQRDKHVCGGGEDKVLHMNGRAPKCTRSCVQKDLPGWGGGEDEVMHMSGRAPKSTWSPIQRDKPPRPTMTLTASAALRWHVVLRRTMRGRYAV